MWLRLGFIAGRVLLRLMIRLAPFLAIGVMGLVRRYRWSLYYRVKGLRPERFRLSAVPAALAGAAGAVLILAVALYLLVTHLAPRA